jgi:hypothetical protein
VRGHQGHVGTAADAASRDLPAIVDPATYEAGIQALRMREKAHTREGDAIAAARRRLAMVEVEVEVEPTVEVTGPAGPVSLLDAFEGRRQLIAYYFMWHPGHPAAEQCQGCTWVTTQVAELAYLHSRSITFAVFCQGPYEESRRYPRLHGLGDALVRNGRRGRDAARAPEAGRDDAPGLLRPGRRPRLRDLLDHPAWRRGHGQQLRAHGPHRARATGAVGGLAPWLATARSRHADRRRGT